MNRLFQYLRTQTFRKNLIVALISTIVILLLLFYSLRFYTRHGEALEVPALKGISVDQAIERLENQGFRYQVDSVYQADKTPGLVIEQDPDAGTKVKQNRTLYLTIITKNAPEVQLPNLTEMAFLEALSTLNNYGLKLGDTIYIPDIARDRVLDMKYAGQKINAGESIPKGSKIDLVLGNGMGESEVTVPNVVGYTLDEAMFSIKGASLTLGTVNYMGPIIDTANAKVISQTPEPDPEGLKKVSIGTPVNLALSN